MYVKSLKLELHFLFWVGEFSFKAQTICRHLLQKPLQNKHLKPQLLFQENGLSVPSC